MITHCINYNHKDTVYGKEDTTRACINSMIDRDCGNGQLN